MIPSGALGSIGDIPSSGYNPVRAALDPNDPDYLKKLGLVGAIEGHHELASQPPAATPAQSSAPQLQPLAPMPTPQHAAVENLHPSGVLGKIGKGILTGAEALGEAAFPTVAANIPGSFTHTNIENQRELERQKQQAGEQIQQETLEQRPELAEVRGEIQGVLQGQKGAQEANKTATTEAGKNERTQAQIGSRELLSLEKPQYAAFHDLMTGNGGQPQPNPDTNKPYTEQEAYQAVQKPPSAGKPVAGTLNGKPSYGLYDPKQGWLDPETKAPIPNFQPPPSWAQSQTPITVISPETGLPTVESFSRGTGAINPIHAAGGEAPITGTGPYSHQIQSASALNRMVTGNVLPLVDQMEKKGELGIVKGRLSDFLNTNVGNAPPDVAQFHQLMNGVVSMMMGMYGFRRQQAVDALSAQMGARMTPESLRAALEGITQHANSIVGGAVNPQGGGAAPPKGNVISLDDFLKK